MTAQVHRLFDDPASRRSSSASMASRMKSERLFGPAIASMRDAISAVMRMVVTTVSTLRLSGGRPIGRVVPLSIKIVNSSLRIVFCY